jgi:hypothetical protein
MLIHLFNYGVHMKRILLGVAVLTLASCEPNSSDTPAGYILTTYYNKSAVSDTARIRRLGGSDLVVLQLANAVVFRSTAAASSFTVLPNAWAQTIQDSVSILPVIVDLRSDATVADSALVDSLAHRRNVTNVVERTMIASYLPLNMIDTLARDPNVLDVGIDDNYHPVSQLRTTARLH